MVTGGQTYKLSLIPSGILSPQVQCVVTGGVVLNPASILQEIDGLVLRGIAVGKNLMLSDRAHVIFPWHIAEDKALDKSCSSGENIGTTMRGIGPCYSDKVGRSFAIRLGDLYRPEFADRVAYITAAKNLALASLNGQAHDPPLDARAIAREYAGYAERLRPFVADTTAYLLDAVEAGRRILLEGHKGAVGRRSRHVPVRHQQQQFRGRRFRRLGPSRPLDHARHRRGQSLFDAHGRRAVSNRTRQRDRPAHSRPRQRIWHRDAPPAPLRLVRRRGRSLHCPAQWRRCAGRDAGRRVERIARVAGLHGL